MCGTLTVELPRDVEVTVDQVAEKYGIVAPTPERRAQVCLSLIADAFQQNEARLAEFSERYSLLPGGPR